MHTGAALSARAPECTSRAGCGGAASTEKGMEGHGRWEMVGDT